MIGGTVRLRPTICIMELLWSINGYADEPVVFTKEGAPFICEQRTVGLQAIVYLTSSGIAALQVQHLPVKTQGSHERFSAMPCEEHLPLCLRFYILTNECLQGHITHIEATMVAMIGVKKTFL